MSATLPTVGAYYEIGYPFIRDATNAGGFAKWKPGCRWDRSVARYDRVGKCDAMGTMLVSVKGVYTPPSYPTRVFFTKRWIDPSGSEFGRNTLRCYALGAFTYLVKGFKHPFEIAPYLTLVSA